MSNTEAIDTEDWVAKTLPVPSDWSLVNFEEAFHPISTSKIKTAEAQYKDRGAFPIVDQGRDFIGGYTDAADRVINRNGAVIVFGDHTRCFKLIAFPFAPGADGTKVLEPRAGIVPKFAYYGCLTLRLPNRGYSRHYSFLRRSQFPIAPLAEQRRIVAKIEELFSELDKGIADLTTAREQLKAYRQSVLKHAFEGKLTGEWRSCHPSCLSSPSKLIARITSERHTKYLNSLESWKLSLAKWESGGAKGKRPVKPRCQEPSVTPTSEELVGFPSLPEGWQWVKLGQLVWSVKDGPHYSPHYTLSGVPFITGGNVRPSGIDFDSAKFISHELHAELSERCKPEKGDVLYTKGGTTGIARVNTYDREFNVWVHVAVLKLADSVRPFYLQHALNSPLCYVQSQRYTHGVGNQDLGLTRMVNIILPLCSEAEQKQIEMLIDTVTSELDQIESTIDENLKGMAPLRQSILKRAFSGQLVAQDAKDEPASILLERIRAEHDAATTKTQHKAKRAKNGKKRNKAA
jgi:type I restriction enzyme, S subunit